MIVLSYPVFASEIQGQDLVLYSIWAVTGIFGATRANFANEVQIVRLACQPLALDFHFDCPRLFLSQDFTQSIWHEWSNAIQPNNTSDSKPFVVSR